MLSVVGSPANRPTVLLSAADFITFLIITNSFYFYYYYYSPSIADAQSAHASIAAGHTSADDHLQAVR